MHHPDGTEIQSMIVFSTARAIWRQNVSLATKLIKSSPLAASFLKVEGNKVFLSNAPQFNMYYDDARVQISNEALTKLGTRMQLASSPMEAKKVKCKIQATKRFLALFWKTNRCLKLSGIRLNDGTVATSPSAVQEGLKEYWGPVYAHSDIDRDAAIKLLKLYKTGAAGDFQFSSVSFPGPADYESFIKKSKESSCGPNGIPYSAYKSCPELAGKVFNSQARVLTRTDRPPGLVNFNKQLCWFAPKGVLDHDKQVVLREPQNLRTIFGGNCDNKCISGTVAHALTPAMLKVTDSCQHGFVPWQTVGPQCC